MKKITHHYGVDLNWVGLFAEKHGGRVEGNFIIVPDDLLTGTRYVLDCGFGISAFYVDVEYHSDIHLRQEHNQDDFIAIYYNLTEGDAFTVIDGTETQLGKWNYNLSFIDSSLKTDYIVKAGSRKVELCIFIKKDLVKEYFQNNPSLKEHADEILNPRLNTIVKFTRMSNDSYHLLMNLHSKEVGSASFDLNLQGTVQCLLGEYIQKMTLEEIVIDKVSEEDLENVLKTQTYLIDNLDKTFPSIKTLSKKARMSPSKYKSMFKKITGLTPNAFFLNNKLVESKKLLSERQLNIVQVSDALGFASNSYFTVKFKEFFGMSPKDFVKQL